IIFLGHGAYQKVVGHNFMLSMAQNTVSNCIQEISHLIVHYLSDEWIQFPTTEEEKLAIKVKFRETTHFPGVIGAVDCTHVAIIAPREEEHNFINRKGYHSKNIQIICDYNLKILNINPQFAGATHDAYIWRNSEVHQELERCYLAGDRHSWLLGDSGYPQQPWLMTPVLNALAGSAEERYNTHHASARNCIERCNGVFKQRFRCVLGERTLRYSPEKVGNIVVACAVLHNICTDARLELDVENMERIIPNEVNVNVQQMNENGRDARRILIENYFQ
ncbi:hypothetical protein PPYR_01946, partial [Photinus pyralis]